MSWSVYARIADRTVADEYFDVTTRVDQIYGRHLPANLEGPNMRRMREQHRRMLGNGWCDRPADMDCNYETICETCTYYTTDTTHVPVLIRQRDHANDHHQPDRTKLYARVISRFLWPSIAATPQCRERISSGAAGRGRTWPGFTTAGGVG
jgi:hypothetical protein